MEIKPGDRVVWYLTRPPLAGWVTHSADWTTIFYGVMLDAPPPNQAKFVQLTGSAIKRETLTLPTC